MKKLVRSVAVAGVAAVAVLGLSGSAMAATPTGQWAPFKYCPYTNPAVTQCLLSTTTSGSFKLGNATVPITASTPITLQGGLINTVAGTQTFVNAVGADSLSKTKLKVPGGLIGLVDTGGFSGALIALFNAAVAAGNDVYATAELVGTPTFDLNNLLTSSGVGLGLPVKVHLENPFLGSNCYIGSAGNPVQLNLTTGTTSPPGPNTPITGSPGTLSFSDDASIVTDTGLSVVNNSFAAPAASNCGYLPLDMLLITAAVNLKEGLPAAAGKNTAILNGTTAIASAPDVAASAH